MFGLFESKKITMDSDGNLLVTKKSRYVCDLNKYIGQSVIIKFKEDHLLILLDEDEVRIDYSRIVSCGKIANTKQDIAKAMETGVLPQSVLSSSGFINGGFYTLTNMAKLFFFFKFRDSEEPNIIHTFLMEYNDGPDKAIKILRGHTK